MQDGQEVSRSFRALAEALADASTNSDGGLDLVYAAEKTDARKKAYGRPNLSPLRAGQ